MLGTLCRNALRLRGPASLACRLRRPQIAFASAIQLQGSSAVAALTAAASCRQLSSSAPAQTTAKKWTAERCLDDHVAVFTSLPNILGAYVGPNSLPPQLGESIMVAVNSVNACPYCEGLHGELARMAGVSKCAALQAAKSVKDCTAVVDDPAVAYARKFAEEAGRGPALKEAYDAVVQKHGSGGAQSVQALCWFLNWGSLGGNTLNSTISQIKESGKCGPFELLFSAYYAPLFGVIALMNAALKRMPKMPDVFFQGIGVTLTIAGGSWLTPVALLALARKAVRGGRA